MHIPDGFLTVNIWAPAWLISISGLGYCLRKTSRILKDRMVPLMGVMAAFIFASQMINFPVIGGTSGHLLGGVLAAVLLGPSAAAIVLACVLTVQCFIFQDGGLTALGANIFNMAILGTGGSYWIYYLIRKPFRNNKAILAAAAVASWCSVVVVASACSLELAFSGTSPLKVVLPAMAFIHMLIGLGEAVITTMIVGFVLKVRPDLIYK